LLKNSSKYVHHLLPLNLRITGKKERRQDIPKGKIQEEEGQRDDRRSHDGGKPGRIEVFGNLREFYKGASFLSFFFNFQLPLFLQLFLYLCP